MTIECPSLQWPAVLEERGPPEDPTVLLTGAARIGDTDMQIVAIRINATLQWTPDLKSDVVEGGHYANGLDGMLESTLEEFESVGSELCDLLGVRSSGTVELATGRYRICVLPASFQIVAHDLGGS